MRLARLLPVFAAAALMAACQPAQTPTQTPTQTPEPAPVPSMEAPAVPTAEPVDEAAPPAQTPVETPVTAAACTDEVGAAAAARLVERCRMVSPATRPPCNVANACALIREHIDWACAKWAPGETKPPECAA